MSRIAAVLLAGGASKRMGQAKALIPYGGHPLWQWQMKTLLALEPCELFISAPLEIDFEDDPWKTIYDREAGLGPLAGLEAALSATTADQLVALAVDMPAVTAEFFGLLIDEAGDSGIVPELDGRYQGLVAIYPRRIYPLVEEILASEDRSFQCLVRRAVPAGHLKVHVVTEG